VPTEAAPEVGILPPEPASSPASPTSDAGILPPGQSSPPASQPTPAAPVPDWVELPPDSFVFAAIEDALDAGDQRRAARVAELAEPYLPPAEPELRKYVRGLKLLADGKPADAAAAMIALADNEEHPGLACRALYYGALAHVRMERPDVARTLCRELLGRKDVPPPLAGRARALLERVGA